MVWLASKGSVVGATIAFIGAITGLCLPFIRAKYRSGDRKAHFATSNGLSYSMGLKAAFARPEKSLLLSSHLVETPVVTEVLRSVDARPLKEMSNIRFSVNRNIGIDRLSTMHTWGCATVTLPTKLPPIILDSLGNNLLGLASLPASLDSKQRLSLEGELDTKFALYAPLDYAQDAYYIFRPDVLIAFTNLSAPYDIEIVEDEMYIYRHKAIDFNNPADIEEISRIAMKLHAIILTKASTYKNSFNDVLSEEQASRDGQQLQI